MGTTFQYIEYFPTDTKFLAYLCGFIATDGCLCRKNSIYIQIQENDAEFLQKIMSKISSKPTLNRTTSKDYSSVGFALVLPKLFTYCLDIGITPDKTYTLDVKLDDKSDEFKWYFLRGVIDGDGCVYSVNKPGNCCITITSSSYKFLQYLFQIFGGRLASDHKSWKLIFTGRQAQQLAKKVPLPKYSLNRKTVKLRKIRSLQWSKKKQPFKRLIGSIWKYKTDEKLHWTEIYKQQKENISVPIRTIKDRINVKGWDMNKAFYTPVRVNKRWHS